MANWCFDPVASGLTGKVQFKHPYPRNGRSWREQMQWNAEPLAAMRHVVEAEQVYNKDPEKWNDDERKFDIETMRGCEELASRLNQL